MRDYAQGYKYHFTIKAGDSTSTVSSNHSMEEAKAKCIGFAKPKSFKWWKFWMWEHETKITQEEIDWATEYLAKASTQ